jgi:cytochrome c
MKLNILTALGAVLLTSSAAQAGDSASVAAGRQVAQRNCATCHAIADGESPLADAPPFARLSQRYGAGGLAELLEKGMIANRPRPLEEGTRLLHPRMPAFPLDDDEVVALADYLRTFEHDGGGHRRK